MVVEQHQRLYPSVGIEGFRGHFHVGPNSVRDAIHDLYKRESVTMVAVVIMLMLMLMLQRTLQSTALHSVQLSYVSECETRVIVRVIGDTETTCFELVLMTAYRDRVGRSWP